MLKRFRVGLARGFAVKTYLHKTSLNLHLEKSLFRVWSPSLECLKCSWRYTQRPRAKITTCICYVRIIENHWFHIVISLSNGLWKLHVCNMVQLEPNFESSKTHIKPTHYCSFAQNDLKTILMRFSIFLRFHQILPSGLQGLPRSARKPRVWHPIVPTNIKTDKNEANII